MVFVRELLLVIEEPPKELLRRGELDSQALIGHFSSQPESVVLGHLQVLVDAGFVEGRKLVATTHEGRGTLWTALELRWAGHDFLDSVRDDRVWAKTLDKVSSTVGTASLAVFKEVAGAVARSLLGLS